MLSAMPTDPFDRNSTFFRNVPPKFEMSDDPAEELLLREYGAVFVARGGVTAPHRVVFEDENEVGRFQSRLEIRGHRIGEFDLELQSAAMDRLLTAIDEANALDLTINPRGADSARRNYRDTIDLWRSRVEPALLYWVEQGRLDQDRADSIRDLSPYEQVPEVLRLEADGIFFAKNLSKSIIYSVAPPGASQHLSLLAFDVAEFDDPEVRRILANNFWYQTVVSDLPHFTFLGVEEGELPPLGLKSVTHVDRSFWLPELG
jgi:hypothetical protein